MNNLSTGKELKIEYPTFNLESGKACKGNYVNESTAKLDQQGVSCEYDATTGVPTIKSNHMTTFIVTVESNGTTTTTTTTTGSSSDDGLSGGAIAGIVIGSLVFVTGVVLLTIFLVKKAKAKKLQKHNGARMSVL